MKNLKVILIILVLLVSSNILKSQNLLNIISDSKTNYFEKNEYIEQYKTPLIDSASDWELKRYYRWLSFWDSRIDQKGEYKSYTNAISNYKLSPNKNTNSEIWESIGPDYNNLQNWFWVGRVQSIWVNPDNLDIIYIGSDNAGLWKTENGGLNWRLLTPNDAFGVHKIVVHPENSDIMFIATGVYANGFLRHNHYGQGVYKSEDAGETWTKLQVIEPEDMIYISDIAYDPKNFNIMYAVSLGEIYKSTDGGTTWNVLINLNLDSDKGSFRNIAINPNLTNNIAISGQNEFHISNDGGETWTSNDFYTTNTNDSKIEIDYSPSGTLYAFYYKRTDGIKDNFLSKSIDNGITWSDIPLYNTSLPQWGYDENYIGGNGTVSILKVIDDNIIYAGGTDVFVSTDGGNNFSNMDAGYYYNVHPDIRDICFPDPLNLDLVYVVTDGGVDKNTLPSINTWQNINGDLSLTECYTIAISEQDPEFMLIGCHDNGTYKRFPDETWRHVKGGDGGKVLISNDVTNDRICFAADHEYLARSTNGGDSFGGAVFTGSKAFDFPVIQDPTNPTIYYAANGAGTGNYQPTIYKSTNSGQTFNDIYFLNGWGIPTALSISASNPDILYLASYNHDGRTYWTLKKVYNNGSDYTNILTQENGYPEYLKITEIAVHPANENIVWITFGNFSAPNKVLQTTDGGATWTNISHDLPNIPVNTVAYDDALDQLYIGTDVGVFYLDNPTDTTFDQTWERYGDFPLVIASDIKINHTSREIVVATYGRGVWRADLACAYTNIPEQITGEKTWNNSRSITNDIEILENSKLTISSDAYIKFAPDAKIVVKPGAELIISGGKLTNSCGEQWQGIVVEGNPNLPQYPNENQGVVKILNGATIENAHTGIHSQNGGVVIAKNSNFTNNFTDIQIENYNYGSINRSKIRNCNFVTTNHFYNYHFNLASHVYLSNTNKITISGNLFENQADASFVYFFRGRGIIVLNSDVEIVAGCSNTQISPCPEQDMLPNQFSSLFYGIDIRGDGSQNNIEIDNNEFSSCITSIVTSSCSPIITRNTVNVPEAIPSYYPSGIYLSNCTGYQVEENKISSTVIANNVGLVVRNSGETANEIYKNEFRTLSVACEAQGNNGTRQTRGGLQFLCNEFSNVGTSIFVTEYTPTGNDTIIIVPDPMRDETVYGIAEYQGSKTLPAQNTFVNTEHDLTNQQAQFYYFYNPFGSNTIPTGNQNVSLQQTASVNDCPSNLNGNPIPIETLSLMSDSISATEIKLVALIDEGETEATVQEIQTADNSDANKLRRELLEKSPTLSDTSLVSTVVIEEVLPPVMLAQILSANPRSAKSDKVMNAISQRTHPLPPPFMDEIMKGQDTVSEREILAAKLNRQHNQRTRLLNQKTRELSNDTVSATAPQELISFLQQENSLSADYRLVDFYLRLQDADKAQNTLSQIPVKYELTANQQTEHQLTTQLTAIQCELIRNGKKYAQMDSIQKQALYQIAENDKYQAGASAQNIISMIDGTEFRKGVVIPHYQIVQKSSEAPQTPIFQFELSPNPADDYFVVDYDLGIRNFTKARFLMFNSNNQKVLEMPITKPAYQLLVETEKYEAGIYTCKIFANNEQLSEKQIAIRTEGLTTENQIVTTETFTVYPNPATNYITVQLNSKLKTKNLKLLVTDNTGKTVKTQKVAKGNSQIKITTSDLANGTYNISLQSDNKIIEKQTMVIKK